MRLFVLLLSVVLFTVASPGTAHSKPRGSASNEANVNRWSRTKAIFTKLDREAGRERLFSWGASYGKYDMGARSKSVPLGLSYAPLNSPFSFGLDTGGYTWDTDFEEPDREGWGDVRGTIDFETGTPRDAVTVGYGFGVSRQAVSNKTDYTHSVHLGYTAKRGMFLPNADLRASWNNGDDPNTWKRSVEVFLGIAAELKEKHKVSFGFVRQLVKSDDSNGALVSQHKLSLLESKYKISSLESKYKFPIAARGSHEMSGVIGLSLDLTPKKESKTLDVMVIHSF